MPQITIPQLGPSPDSPFPDPARLEHPDGLLAWGGDLSPTRLIGAYRNGIFPWFDDATEILWWSPEPRAVLIPGGWHLPKRLKRTLRQARYAVTLDQDFEGVIDGCAESRSKQSADESKTDQGEDDNASQGADASTWITPDMRRAYIELHQMGIAHSIEIHSLDGDLIGGLYGVALGQIFFAESKFHRARDASKIALAMLMRLLEMHGFLIADCQLWNPHLETLGVRLLSGEQFRHVLRAGIEPGSISSAWPTEMPEDALKRW